MKTSKQLQKEIRQDMKLKGIAYNKNWSDYQEKPLIGLYIMISILMIISLIGAINTTILLFIK